MFGTTLGNFLLDTKHVFESLTLFLCMSEKTMQGSKQRAAIFKKQIYILSHQYDFYSGAMRKKAESGLRFVYKNLF